MLAKDLFFINSRCAGILDSVKDEIIVTNNNDEIIFANKLASKILGENYLKKKFTKYLLKKDLSQFNSAKKEGKMVSLTVSSKRYDIFVKKEDKFFILTFKDENYVQNIGEITLLNRMLEVLSTETDIKKILDSVLSELLNFFKFEFGGIYLAADNCLLLKAKRNVPESFAKITSKIKIQDNYRKIFEKKSATILEYDKYKPKESKELGIKLVISIPVSSNGKPVGLINLASKEKVKIDKKLMDTVENLANVLGNALRKIEADKSSKINEDRFNAISHTTDEFMLIIDRKGRMTFSKLGYSREELVGQNFGKICKNCSKKNLGKKKVIIQVADSIGNLHLFETSISRIISDGSKVLISRDVTEKRTLEEMIKNERNKLQEYLDNIPMIFLALDINGAIKMINNTGCVMLKEKKENIIGKNWFENYLPKDLQKPLKRKFFKALYGEKKEYSEIIENVYENEIVCNDKEVKRVEWNNSFIKNEKGIINLIIAVGRDVTKEKEKEKEIESLRKNNELSEMRKNFLMLVTHELKQPLTPIMGYADLLKEGIVDVEKLKFLDRIINGGQDMLDLITRIINLMKLESGELMFNYKEVSIQKIIEEALRKKASFINLKSVRIEKKIRDVTFAGDFNLLRDVMLNLIDNAVKFSPEKSVITIKAGQLKDKVFVDVIDQGVGMEKADAENLFKSFSQSEIGRKKGGFGIGLAMSKMIVEKHKGKLSAKSEPNKGSTFTVTLPVKRTEEIKK